MRFFYLKNLALPLMGDFWEKTIQSGFPAQSCFTRSGVRTICDLEEAVPSLLIPNGSNVCFSLQVKLTNSTHLKFESYLPNCEKFSYLLFANYYNRQVIMV